MLFTTLGSGVLQAAAQDASRYWTDLAPSSAQKQSADSSPTLQRSMRLDATAMQRALGAAPSENVVSKVASPVVIELPFADGSFGRFGVVESSIMEPELAARYPDIRTYAAVGLDDRTATARLDFTPRGFHAVIHSVNGTVYVDPLEPGVSHDYVVYRPGHGPIQDADEYFEVGVDGADAPHLAEISNKARQSGFIAATGPQLRTYRIAIAATGEYSGFHGGTVPGVLAEITTTLNRVNEIYEREVSMRMVLVANNDQVIFLNAATDPYSNFDPPSMLGENQTEMDATIGNANYDIGHVFGTGGGGIASVGVPCRTFLKARGVSTSGLPTGDGFVGLVAHEIGHQWSARHTFNGTAGSCGPNRTASSAYEPGSGTTIMSYAGICSSQNIQAMEDHYYHTRSFQSIESYSNFGSGNSCAVITATGNNAPVPNAGSSGFFIPISTPFELTGSATDADGDTLTYCWEQYDLGAAGAPDMPTGDAPIFRSFPPTLSPTRVFPQPSDLLNNTTTLGEILPTYSRNLTFRLTARDNLGGVAYDQMDFDVTAAAGPFLVTSPNTASVVWIGGDTETVTWDVAGTSGAPVNATNVDIFLSLDGGNTYPLTLASNVANDGSQDVTVPVVLSENARVKVKGAGNVFFDISNEDFTVLPVLPDPIVVTSVAPDVGFQDTAVQLTVLGSGFNSFAQVDLGAGVTVVDVDSVSSDSLLVDIQVDAAATPGFRDLIVADQVTADTLLSGFEVRGSTAHYVAPTGSNTFPYETPAKAAHTVNAAIAAAAAGDSVLVDSTTVVGAFAVTKGVIVYGGWMNNFTLRDVDNVKTVVNLDTGLLIESLSGTAGIDGFILQGGKGVLETSPIVGRYGGGLRILQTPDAVVTRCEFRNNEATAAGGYGAGGGIAAVNSGVLIDDNLIETNTGTQGGGIYCHGASGTVSNNVISLNAIATDLVNDAVGSGIFVDQSTGLLLTDNTVDGNTGALDGGGIWVNGSTGISISGGSVENHVVTNNGAGIHLSDADVSVNGVVISQNNAANGGGGLASLTSSTLTLEKCQVLSNSGIFGGGVYALTGEGNLRHNLIVDNSGTVGAGAYLATLTSGDVQGNTLDRNDAGAGVGGLFSSGSTLDIFNNIVANTTGIAVFCDGSATLTYNLVFNSSGADYQGCAPGVGSLTGDPVFADTTSNDYHLGLHSAAIDAGRPGPPWNDPDGSRGDMGWYGSHSFVMDQPVFPTGLNAGSSGGQAVLDWQFNPEPDVDVYAVYCDSVSGFTPGLGNFVTTTADSVISFAAPADTTYYVISAVDTDGYASGYSAEVQWVPDGASSTNTPGVFVFALQQNVPNPFNPATQISFTLAQEGVARLTIYDVAGRAVRVLLNESRPAGRSVVPWDGRDSRGRAVASGIYYYRLEAEASQQTRKMLLLK